jgi:hypothetical protein
MLLIGSESGGGHRAEYETLLAVRHREVSQEVGEDKYSYYGRNRKLTSVVEYMSLIPRLS